MKPLFYLALLSLALLAFRVASASQEQLPCAGCAPDGSALLDENDGDAQHTCPNSACYIVLWSTVSGFSENCGGFVDCNLKTCNFTWKMKYKTSGCTNVTEFMQAPTSPAGSTVRWPSSGSAVVIDEIAWSRGCGVTTTRTGTMSAINAVACGTLSFSYDFTVGCDGCE